MHRDRGSARSYKFLALPYCQSGTSCSDHLGGRASARSRGFLRSRRLLLRLLFLSQAGQDGLSGLLIVVAGLVHPRVSLNLLDGRAFVPVVSEETQYEVLKLGTQ